MVGTQLKNRAEACSANHSADHSPDHSPEHSALPEEAIKLATGS